MADFYVKSGQATERANSTAYALGAKMVPLRTDTSTNHAVAKRWVWECTVAGTSGAAVPTWPASVTQDTTTVTDGTVTWRARKPGFSSGTTANWTFAHPYLDMMLSGTAAGDRIFVSNNHNETSAAAIIITFPGTLGSPNYVLCVDDSAAPPTALATGGTIANTGTFGMRLEGTFYVYGLTFSVGTGTGLADLTIGSGDNSARTFESCRLRIGNTNIGSRIRFGQTAGAVEQFARLKNTTVRYSNATQSIDLTTYSVVMDGGGIEAGGTAPVAFCWGQGASLLTVNGADLSGMTTSANLLASGVPAVGRFIFRNCKMPASWSGQLAVNDPANMAVFLGMYGCDSAGGATRLQTRAFTGSVFSEGTIKRTGGAPVSWRMVSTANAEFPVLPLSSPEIYFYNTTVGSPVTVTVEVITDNVTLTDQQAWVDVMAMNTSGSVQGTWASDAGVLLTAAVNQPTSSEAWTTTGLTTPVKQKLSVTFTPQVAGDFIAIVRLCRASTTMYVDPAVVVT